MSCRRCSCSGSGARCLRRKSGARPSANARDNVPGIAELFRGEARRTALLVILVCSVSLTAHWAFIFWYQQHLRNLPDVIGLPAARKNEIASLANFLVMSAAIVGKLPGRSPGAADGLSPRDRRHVPGLLPFDGW